MKKKVFAAAFIAFMLLTGCANEKVVQADKNELTILVTRDYGREIIEEKIVLYKDGDTVMDLMQDNFDVETAYGGGFLNSIDGIVSGYTGEGNSQKKGTKMDWFYYINGVMAEVGADQYLAKDANTISWDFHDWGGDMYVKTRIDAWPERLDGRDVEISWSSEYEAEASKIKNAAQNAGGNVFDSDVESMDMDDFDKDAIFIGTWEDALNNEFIKKAFKNRERAGLYTGFSDQGLLIFDDGGNICGSFETGAAIVAIQKAYGSEAAVLLIIGNENSLVKKAVNIFMDEESMKGAFAFAVTEDGVYGAP